MKQVLLSIIGGILIFTCLTWAFEMPEVLSGVIAIVWAAIVTGLTNDQ